jgi:hypothetical protein
MRSVPLQFQPPTPLLELARASYAASQGTCIIIGSKGLTRSCADNTEYYVTSLVVHSVDHRFGVSDRGREGIERFLRSVSGLEELQPAWFPMSSGRNAGGAWLREQHCLPHSSSLSSCSWR